METYARYFAQQGWMEASGIGQAGIGRLEARFVGQKQARCGSYCRVGSTRPVKPGYPTSTSVVSTSRTSSRPMISRTTTSRSSCVATAPVSSTTPSRRS